MKKYIKTIAVILIFTGMVCIYLGVSTDDFYTMELRELVPAYVCYMKFGGVSCMITGFIMGKASGVI